MSGKRINKIRCQSKKKVKKLIFNGKRNLNFQSLKPEKRKIREKLESPDKTFSKEEGSDTDGKKPNNLEVKEDKEAKVEESTLRIRRHKFSRKGSKPNSSKKLQKEVKADPREEQKEDPKEDQKED